MDVVRFLQAFPEFEKTSPEYVEAKLAEASASMGMNGTGGGGAVWGSFASPGKPLTLADIYQGNFAADLLWSSPFGASTLMVSQNNGEPSFYKKRCNDLEQSIFPLVVAGGSRGGVRRW